MNIYKHELKLYFKTTVIWMVSLIAIIFFFAGIYPMFSDSAAAVSKILESFPDGLKNALGLTTLDLSSFMGFFGFMFAYILVVGGVQGMNMGLSLLSNEQREKTADFLMAKPVKRIEIVHAKLLSGLTYIVLTNIAFSIGCLYALTFIAGAEIDMKLLFLFLGSLFFTQLFFMSLGLFMSVFMDKLKTVVPVSLGVVFGFFILNMLNESIEGRPLSALTPFAYYNPGYIYSNMSYDMKWLILNGVLVILFTLIAYMKFIKKDIPSV